MKRLHKRGLLFLIFLALIPIGYFLRFRAPWSSALRDSSGGAVYVLLWTVLAGACFPLTSSTRLAFAVTATTCILEFLQLWCPPWLEAIRSTFAGRVVLGTTFGWSDFPPYFAGGLAGWLLLSLLCRYDD